MSYTYPDKGDRITIELINEVSKGSYWEDSEKHVLDMALAQVRELNRPRHILDLGCGLGRLFPVFAPEADTILGLEPDAERFLGAQASAAAVTEAECNVICSDSSVLDPEVRFDVILSSHVFQHIPHALCLAMADTMSAHLRPGGLLILTTTHTAADEDILTAETMDGGHRAARTVDLAEFGTLFDMDGVLPVRLFAEATIEQIFRERGFTLLLRRVFHYDGVDSVAYDDAANASADGHEFTAHGRDCMYIFRRD